MPQPRRQCVGGGIIIDRFTYRAKDAEGREVEGTSEAVCSSDAANELLARGLLPTHFKAGVLTEADVHPPHMPEPYTPRYTLVDEGGRRLRCDTRSKYMLMPAVMAILGIVTLTLMWAFQPAPAPNTVVITVGFSLMILGTLYFVLVRKRIIVNGPVKEVIIERYTGSHVWGSGRRHRRAAAVVHRLKCFGDCEIGKGSEHGPKMELRPVAEIVFVNGKTMIVDAAADVDGVRQIAERLAECMDVPLEDRFRDGMPVPVSGGGQGR